LIEYEYEMSDDESEMNLLEEAHEFPCVFTMKVVGKTENEFVERVLKVIAEYAGQGTEFEFFTRSTSGGRHVAVTVSPELESAQQVTSLYAELRQLDGIVMLM